MSRVAEQAAFLLDVCKLVQFATERGFTVTGGELYRTAEQQQIYVKTGRSKTMNSRHLERLAVDLNFFKGGQLRFQERADTKDGGNRKHNDAGRKRPLIDERPK